MEIYHIVLAIDTHFGFLSVQNGVPFMADSEDIALCFDAAETAHDYATDLNLDSYEVVTKGYGVVTDCPPKLLLKKSVEHHLN